jgi:hypothetical protein
LENIVYTLLLDRKYAPYPGGGGLKNMHTPPRGDILVNAIGGKL